jgi:hypothetical protein
MNSSNIHVGGVLQQQARREQAATHLYLKKLWGAGTRYSTFDRELLAAFSAVLHFPFLLKGQCFCLPTDHKPLVTALFRTTPNRSARQQRQLFSFAEF